MNRSDTHRLKTARQRPPAAASARQRVCPFARLPVCPATRRGVMYAVVMGTAVIVTVIGLAALMSVRITRYASQGAGELAEARFYARSAVELGMLEINGDANWRTNRSSGAWTTDQPIGTGTYSLEVIDSSDGDFTNDPEDHVIITGTGKAGEARYNLSVELAPDQPPGMDFLASAIHTSTLFWTDAVVTVDAPISSNLSIEIDSLGGVVNGNLEAVDTVSVGGTLKGTSTVGIDPKEVPASAVFDYYIANATPIDINSIPTEGEALDRVIADTLITPDCPPFGALSNAEGLYLIDCQNEKLRIRDTRIHGTLVILDPKKGSKVEGSVNWEPYRANLPALMVRGSIDFEWSGALSEAGTTNFNPIACPYKGLKDVDLDDSYPGVMKGLIVVSGELKIKAAQSIEGVILCTGSEMRVEADLTVTHDSTIINDPPPGFERSFRPMLPIAGSWKRLPN